MGGKQWAPSPILVPFRAQPLTKAARTSEKTNSQSPASAVCQAVPIGWPRVSSWNQIYSKGDWADSDRSGNLVDGLMFQLLDGQTGAKAKPDFSQLGGKG